MECSKYQFTGFLSFAGLANSCKEYPSEYAYRHDSVTRTEVLSANCIRYPRTTPVVTSPEQYIHCNGRQLKLIDSDRGSEQYNGSDYYVWQPSATGSSQLMFIFTKRVDLTTITLHYYSDSAQGLPRLRFFAVPENFDIWNIPTASYRLVEVAAKSPQGESAGQRNINTSLNFNTAKVLMLKLRSTYSFAVSEVEFFTACTGK